MGVGVFVVFVVMVGGGQQGVWVGQVFGFVGGMEFFGGSGEVLWVEVDVVV